MYIYIPLLCEPVVGFGLIFEYQLYSYVSPTPHWSYIFLFSKCNLYKHAWLRRALDFPEYILPEVFSSPHVDNVSTVHTIGSMFLNWAEKHPVAVKGRILHRCGPSKVNAEKGFYFVGRYWQMICMFVHCATKCMFLQRTPWTQVLDASREQKENFQKGTPLYLLSCAYFTIPKQKTAESNPTERSAPRKLHTPPGTRIFLTMGVTSSQNLMRLARERTTLFPATFLRNNRIIDIMDT